MNKLIILKASAGSGKTHDLTQQYIDFILPPDEEPFNPSAFRHILAVTFTNKATDEMKSRIIDEIYALSQSEEISIERRRRAKEVLTAILHDYSSFSVSTIDKFFQMVMRAFSREINQYASYNVELDTTAVLQQAVDRMMASLDEPSNSELLEWLTKYALERIEAGYKWDISDELFKMATLFMREDFKLKRREKGLNWDKEKIKEFSSKLDTLCEDPDKQTKATAELIRDNVYLLGIFTDLYNSLQSYLSENNLVLLGETADVLNRIIDGSDTPFIYEKIGTRFDHFMLDEFQDTSRLQWENFRPLISESLAHGEDSLIVGDIKQSIYRWRNSDLRLLDTDVYMDFGQDQISSRPKQENWRSYENIVKFNNDFYSHIASLAASEDPTGRIARYYADTVQKIPSLMSKHLGLGYVRVQYLKRKSDEDETLTWKDTVLERLGEDIEMLKSVHRPCDIAVLVRTNSDGELIARRLLSLGYEVITEDSLMLSSSETLRKLIAVLKYIANPQDSINTVTISMLFNTDKPDITGLDTKGSLYSLCDSILREKLSPLPEGETPFVFAFLDELLNYIGKFGSNLRGFIKWWDEGGSGKCISAPKSDNAIRVMTIHKSKGLSANAVILPFFNEPLHKNKETMIWCEPRTEPFKSIGLVPVKCTSALKNTIFASDYDEERLMQVVDNINTAYVATTRAICNMLIYCPEPKFTKKGAYDSRGFGVSDWLYEHLKGELDGNMCWSVGELCKDTDPKTVAETFVCRDFKSRPFKGKLRIQLRGGEYFNRELGTRYHDILSLIEDESGIDRAVSAALADGLISEQEVQPTRNVMLSVIRRCAPLHWFDGTYRCLNEVSLVDAQGEVTRPDRVLVEKDKPLGEGEAIVIDYKFGEKKSQYRKQVQDYMEQLRNMGYSKVSGALLYCKDEIEIENI